jgi:4-alpha-glucanotransferase
MAPLQDILGLGADARVTAPGTMGPHNWSWRVRADALNRNVAKQLYHLTELYQRL